MKKIALLAALSLSLFAGFRSDAQVNINVQLGAPVVQQPWYASDNDYIYMPDQGVYFNTRRQVYVFQDGGRWNSAKRLPARYGKVSYKSVRTVKMHDARPFERDNKNHRRFTADNGGSRNNDRGMSNGRDGRNNNNDRRGR